MVHLQKRSAIVVAFGYHAFMTPFNHTIRETDERFD